LRTAVLSVDKKINEVSDKVESKITGKDIDTAARLGGDDDNQDMRRRRKVDEPEFGV